MRKLAYLITLIILVFSVIGLHSGISDLIAACGQFILLRMLLCIMGITCFVLLMLNKRIYVWLNVIWFLPQVIVLAERFVDPVYDAYAERVIYDLTIFINSVLFVSVEKSADVFLRIGFNLIGIVGLILSVVIASHVFRKNRSLAVKKQK